jgi:HSP20 family protein
VVGCRFVDGGPAWEEAPVIHSVARGGPGCRAVTAFDHKLYQFEGREGSWAPAIDVEHDYGNLLVHAKLPGIKPDEVKIDVQDNILTVSGEHREAKEEKEKNYLRRERGYGGFSCSMALHPGVDPKKIKAKTHDGIVDVTIPLPRATKETVKITATSS